MTGKKVVFTIIAFSIIILIVAWIWLQYVIKDYDLDVSQRSINEVVTHKVHYQTAKQL